MNDGFEPTNLSPQYIALAEEARKGNLEIIERDRYRKFMDERRAAIEMLRVLLGTDDVDELLAVDVQPLSARITQLLEALEPFAKAYGKWRPNGKLQEYAHIKHVDASAFENAARVYKEATE